MKRLTVFQNERKRDGKVLSVPLDSSLDDILEAVSEKLQITVEKLYTQQGGHIDNAVLIRDDDVLFASHGELPEDVVKSRECSPQPACCCKLQRDTSPCPSVCSQQQREDSPQLTCCNKLQKTQACADKSHLSDWITLNVGGKLFSTTRSTLTRTDPNSMLARMFEDESGKDILLAWRSSVDESGAYLIDRSPLYFEPILNYLRHRKLILDKNINPAGVLEEAKFFGLTSLIETLEEIIEKEQPADDSSPITRREFVFRLLSTPTTVELRCQGMNFTGANLTKLDLRHINFKYTVLRNANLSGANLSYCNFERADLSRTVLDSANLLGVKMLCVNLEGASLRGCNFEDPAGSRANMEGALMKSVDLEGSHMAGVNLRVANLKNANLQNCDLRGAVLAGADLENCDLSGCDLQEANLRGANLKGVVFELMINPLHMAQTVR